MIVRTVLGDIDPGSLGVTYAHEHIVFDGPVVTDRFPDIVLDDADAAVAELGDCRAAGVTAVVDALPAGIGRHPIRLAEISRAAGVHVVATTGLHTAAFYPGVSWANEADPDVLTDLFVADIVEGIDRFDYRGPVVERTEVRAGVIKAGTLGNQLTERDRRLLAAAAATHLVTGAPVLTHCEGGLGGLRQVSLLGDHGVQPERIVLSHTDKNPDTGYHRDLLDSGVLLEYDQALRRPPDAPDGTAFLMAEMVEAGYASQLMLGTDGARRSMWSSLGGSPGLAWLITDFVAVLAAHGLDADVIDQVLVANPAKFFSFRSVMS